MQTTDGHNCTSGFNLKSKLTVQTIYWGSQLQHRTPRKLSVWLLGNTKICSLKQCEISFYNYFFFLLSFSPSPQQSIIVFTWNFQGSSSVMGPSACLFFFFSLKVKPFKAYCPEMFSVCFFWQLNVLWWASPA